MREAFFASVIRQVRPSMPVPRYPKIRVHVESRNPLTLVAAVRQALRRARVEKEEISRFSEEAFGRHGERQLESVCRAWVRVV